MNKSEVYSWRLDPELKLTLEEAASERGQSIAQLLDGIVRDWLRRAEDAASEEERYQWRLREAASEYVGAIRGGDPDRAEQSRERVRERLRKKNRRAR